MCRLRVAFKDERRRQPLRPFPQSAAEAAGALRSVLFGVLRQPLLLFPFKPLGINFAGFARIERRQQSLL
jgi:hypothetical protein